MKNSEAEGILCNLLKLLEEKAKDAGTEDLIMLSVEINRTAKTIFES